MDKHEKRDKWRQAMEGPGTRDLILGGLGLFFLLQGSTGVAFVLLGIEAMLLFRWFSNPFRSKVDRIRSDARGHDCRVPSDPEVQLLLLRVYKRHDRSIRNHPGLESVYRELLDGMWEALSGTDRLTEYRRVIREVLESWPVPGADRPEPLMKARIQRAHEAVRNWDAAHEEVYGS